MTTNPISGSNSAPPTGTTGTTGNSTPADKSAGLANEQTFLKLLVAQLQNQDPTQPQDGIQFVSQLAQFSGLEQNLQMRQDLDAILKTLQSNTGNTSNNSATPKG